MIPGPVLINERSAFIQMVDRSSLAGKCLYVADRGYFSLNVLAHVIRAEQFFLIGMNSPDTGPSFPNRFDIALVKRIYHMRWNIETSFRYLKYNVL